MDRNRDSGCGRSVCYEIGMVYVGVVITGDVLSDRFIKSNV